MKKYMFQYESRKWHTCNACGKKNDRFGDGCRCTKCGKPVWEALVEREREKQAKRAIKER